MDLCTGSAGARVTHAPEVVRLAHLENAAGKHICMFLPEIPSLIVIFEDRDPQTLSGQPDHDG